MKNLLITTLLLTFASAAMAAARVEVASTEEAQEAARQAAYDRALNDHPKTEPISNPAINLKTSRIELESTDNQAIPFFSRFKRSILASFSDIFYQIL